MIYIDDVLIADESVCLSNGIHKIVIEQRPLTKHEYYLYKEYILDYVLANKPEEYRSSPYRKQYYTIKETLEVNITSDSFLEIEIVPKHLNEESKECFDILLNSNLSIDIVSKEYAIEKYSLISMKRLKIIQRLFAIPILIIIAVMIYEIICTLF
jgi:hypothetical protein